MSKSTGAVEAAAARADEYAGALPERLDPVLVRRLSELSPAISTLHIALEWGAIVAAASLCAYAFHPLTYAISVAFIGARQHALLVLAHDAAHHRLFRSRRLNDWVGELLLAWPFLLLTMRAYRRNHFPHHRHLNTDDDPDWVRKQGDEWRFPKSRGQLARLLAADAVGIGFLKFVLVALRLPRTKLTDDGDRAFALGRLAFVAALALAVWRFSLGREFLLYWIVPYLTWMQLCFRVRSIAEHFGIQGRVGVYAQTRTVLATLFDRLFLVPKNVGYHLEHHLYPSVPFHRLPALHAALMDLPGYRASVHVTRGYLNVLRECSSTRAESE